MKKVKVNLATTLLTGSLLLTMTGIEGKVEAAELVISKGVDVYVNDTYFVPTDVNGNEIRPFIYNGSTYLPVRAVGEAYGVEIGWDGRVLISGEANKDVKIPETNKTKIARTDVKVDAVTDVEILVNGNKFVPKDANGNEVPVILTNGTTYLPVRAISNLYGIDINWDSKTGNVYIGKHEIKNYDVKLEIGTDGKYVLPEDEAERIKFIGDVLQMNQYYTDLLKPYSELATNKSSLCYKLETYLYDVKSNLTSESDLKIFEQLKDEINSISLSLNKIKYAERDYNNFVASYNEALEKQSIYLITCYSICIDTASKKETSLNIESILDSMNEQIYEAYIQKIDNLGSKKYIR